MSHGVCVVGAGPGGLFLAKLLSENGIRPLVLEKNKNVTDAVCGELTSKDTLKMLGISKKSEIVSNEFQRTKVICLDSKVEMEIGKKIIGENFLLDSGLMKTYLKEAAESNGAVFKFNSMVRDVIKSDGFIKGVKTDKKKYRSSITVGADGSMSVIAPKAGFDLTRFRAVPSIKIKFKNCKDLARDCAYFYLGRDVGIGYIWLYPRSETEANVGIGSVDNAAKMSSVLRNFIKSIPELEGSKVVVKGSDTVPYSGLLPKFTGNGILLIGDSAGQVSNMLGGGLNTTLNGAKMSSEVITSAIESQDYSERHLKRYEENYRKNDIGVRVQNTADYLSGIIKFSEKADLFDYVDEILEYVGPDLINKIIDGRFSKPILLKAVISRPLTIPLILRIAKNYYF